MSIYIHVYETHSCIQNTCNFSHVALSQDFEERIVKLRTIIHNLPMDHYNLLETLFAFLVLVATKHPATKMSTENLSIVIGPNILVAPESSGFVSDMDTTSVVCNTCVLMIDHYSQIFKVRLQCFSNVTPTIENPLVHFYFQIYR